MSVESSGHLTLGSVRRSLSFTEDTSIEGQGVANGKDGVDTHTPEEHVPAEEQLRNDCENLWHELRNTHARLQTRPTSTASEVEDSDLDGTKVHERILRAKEKKLQAEIIALENQGLQVTSTNPEYTEARLKSQLLTSINQLEETLKIVKGQRKEVEEDLNREEEILKQHQHIANSLTMKIASLEQAKESFDHTRQTQDLGKQKKAANVYLSQTMKKLGSFISSNFPLPSPDDFQGRKNQAMGVKVDPNVTYVSLQQLTEDLMNMLYCKPHDPYIRIEHIHWPPYIELLLRWGIAQRHPQDCNLIRLVAFNR